MESRQRIMKVSFLSLVNKEVFSVSMAILLFYGYEGKFLFI